MPQNKELIKTEEELSGSESILHSFFDSPGVMRGIVDVVADDDVRHIVDNEVTAGFLGLTPEAMRGKLGSELGEPREVLRTWVSHYRQSQSTGKPVSFEYLDERGDHHAWLSAIVNYQGTKPEGQPRFAYSVIDITERKRAEEELRYHANLADNVSDAIISTDRELKIRSWNKAAEHMYGWQADEVIGLIGSDVLQTTFPEGLSREAISRDIFEKGGWEGELIQRTKDGRDLTVYARSMALKDRAGNVIGGVSISQDITERKRMEEMARIEERRLHSIIKISQYNAKSVQELLDYALDEAISLSESKLGYILYYSEEKREFTIHAWSKEVMKECSIAHPPTVYQLDHTGLWGEAVRQRRPIIINDFVAPNPLRKGYPEGHANLFRFMTVPVFIDDRIVAVVAVANKTGSYSDHDARQLTMMMDSIWSIVERKQMGWELQKSERKYRSIVEQSRDGITLVDESGYFIEWNPGMEALTGLKRDDILGRFSWDVQFDLVPDERRTFELYEQIKAVTTNALKTGKLPSVGELGERTVQRPDGTRLAIEEMPSIISTEKGYMFCSILRDITSRKKAEEEREHLISDLATEKALWQTTVENMLNLVTACDAEGLVTYINPAYLQLIERPMAEGISIEEHPDYYQLFGTDGTLFSPEDLPLQRAALTGQKVRNLEIIHRSASGCEFTTIFSAAPLYDAAGRLIGAVAVGHDITEQRRAEQELRRARNELELRVQERTSELMKAKEAAELPPKLNLSFWPT